MVRIKVKILLALLLVSVSVIAEESAVSAAIISDTLNLTSQSEAINSEDGKDNEIESGFGIEDRAAGESDVDYEKGIAPLFKITSDDKKSETAKVTILDNSENAPLMKIGWDNSTATDDKSNDKKKGLKFKKLSLDKPDGKVKAPKVKREKSGNVKLGLSIYEEAAFGYSLNPRLTYFLFDLSSQYSFDILLKDRHEVTLQFGHTLGLDKLLKARVGYLIYFIKPNPIRLGLGIEGGPLRLTNDKKDIVRTFLGVKGVLGAVLLNKKVHIDAYGVASFMTDFVIEGGLRVGVYF